MKKSFFVLPIIFLQLFASCEKEANIELPEAKPMIALTSFISPDYPVFVLLTKTTPFFNSDLNSFDYEPIPNAVVKLTDQVDTLYFDYDFVQMIYVANNPNNLRIQPGKTYHVYAEAPGLDAVSASCTVPAEYVDTNSIRVQYSQRKSDNVGWGGSDSIANSVVSWADLPGTNYYRLQALVESGTLSTVFESMELYFVTRYFRDQENVPTITSGVGEAYIQGADIYEKRDIAVTILNTDVNYYRYHRSLENADFDNPFSEPSPVFSNVKNGFGVFGAYMEVKKKVKVF